MTKRIDPKLQEALKAVGAVHLRSNKHHIFRLPSGRNFVTSGSPGDRRNLQNALRELKRALSLDTAT